MTPKQKAEELLMYYMEVPKDNGYVINIEHGRQNAFKAIIEVQYAIAQTGKLSGFWFETGEELERIYKKYKKEFIKKDAK
jgi:hypothetical protein